MRIVITGAAGRLGSALSRVLQTSPGLFTVIPADSTALDVTDYRAVRAFLQDVAPEWVIHCAAWTDVDGCARDPDRALRVNGLGAGSVAAAAAAVGAGIMQISTNEVFSGEHDRPYHEYDTPAPINPYGASKWAGEQAVMRAAPRHIIVRTSWLFAHGGRNFAHIVLNAGREGRALRVVHDEIACPTYTDDLADALVQLLDADRPGTYHLVNDGACSRYEMALYILERAGFDVPVTPIPSSAWQRASTPPRFSPLANHAAAMLGIRLRSWQAAVDAFLTREGLLMT
jgi:dTDP-4-dehydrorhamnose reductase